MLVDFNGPDITMLSTQGRLLRQLICKDFFPFLKRRAIQGSWCVNNRIVGEQQPRLQAEEEVTANGL